MWGQMAKKNLYSASVVPEKAVPEKKNTWYKTIIDLTLLGTSDRAIAVRLGCSLEDYITLVNYEENGQKPIKNAINLAKAEREIMLREIRQEIIEDPNQLAAVRMKGAMEGINELVSEEVANKAQDVFSGYTFKVIGAPAVDLEDEDE
jgi:hypothetical protein